MYEHVPPPHCHQGLQLLRASEEGDEATVTSLLQSGVSLNFSHWVREMVMYMGICMYSVRVYMYASLQCVW